MYDRDYAAALEYEAPQTTRTDTFALDNCSDTMVCELEGVDLESRGRIVELSVRLHNICPGKRVALGVVLHEAAADGQTQSRGMKTLTIPAHNEPHPCHVLVRRIRFVLPEELSLSTDGTQRHFVVHTVAHYIDVDASCLCALPSCGRN